MTSTRLSQEDYWRALFAGIAVGSLTALLANTVAATLGADASRSSEFSPRHIIFACLISNVVGSMGLLWLKQKARHPFRNYSMLALGVATLASIKVVIFPPSEDFALIASLLHFLVATLSFVALPWLVPAIHPAANSRPSKNLRGRVLVSIAASGTALAPQFADFNVTHLCNPQWPAHARYHSLLLMWSMLWVGLASLVLLWRPFPREERNLRIQLAALLPALIWIGFILSWPIPGTSIWPDGTTPFGPVNGNLLIGGLFILLAWLGWNGESHSLPRAGALDHRGGGVVRHGVP